MADGANRYSKACDAMTALRAKAAGAFDLGYKLLAMCREAGLPEPVVFGNGGGDGDWSLYFPRRDGGPPLRAWAGDLGGIDLKEVDDYAWVSIARDRTPEQAVEWLKERLK